MKTLNYGTVYNKNATLYYLENSKFKVAISDFGASIQEYTVKTKNGAIDIVLGFDTALLCVESGTYAGAIIGRVANGIENATFTLGGKKYDLFINEPYNICNHGGERGFDKYFYEVKNFSETEIVLTRTSQDGEENFPHSLQIEVTYILTDNGLSIKIKGLAGGETYFAPTSHPYFNLSGFKNSVESVLLKVNAQKYTVKGESGLPNGKIEPIKNTPYNFGEFKELGTYDFDVNFCAESEHKATAIDKNSNLQLDVYSNLKGLQLYTPNFTKTVYGKQNLEYNGRCAFCLEPQFYPNAVNLSEFTKPLIKKGEQKEYYINYFVTEV